MTTLLEQKVADLPEVYQTIYGHPEWDTNASRDCNERLGLIEHQYSVLSHQLGRPLRVLDLGCAQGFFSLSLAAQGAHVTGIDFLPQNIAVCQALADENPGFSIQFREGKIEEVITVLEEGEFDLAIGLSVFHHIVHMHGLAKTREWIDRLATVTSALILELAVKEEPLYWSVSLPEDPSELIASCAFYRVLEQFPTHLSEISRPLYIVSNHLLLLENFTGEFKSWASQPYRGAGNAHHGSRRYYWGEHFFAKVFNEALVTGQQLKGDRERNTRELQQEYDFLSAPPEHFDVPELIAYGTDDVLQWLIVESFSGELLSDLIARHVSINREIILGNLLKQLVLLEKNGLYHDDVRPWNVMVFKDEACRLIDLGSISPQRIDCDWPKNLILSFMVFVNELYGIQSYFNGLRRSAPINPFNLPAAIRNWLYAVWKTPVEEWSYQLLETLYEQRDALPDASHGMTAVEQWLSAQEEIILQSQSILLDVTHQQAHLLHRSLDHEEQQSSLMEQQIATTRKHDRLERRFTHLMEEVALLQSRHNEHLDLSRSLTERVDKLTQDEEIVIPKTPDEERAELQQALHGRTQELDEAHAEIQRLVDENHHFRSELDILHNSRSWKITRGCRYVGNQLRKLKHEGIVKRVKALIKKILRRIIEFLRYHPRIKEWFKSMLQRIGLFALAEKVYWKLYKSQQNEPVSMAEHQINTLQIQLDHPDYLPNEVRDIFNYLKNKG
ncbi:O-antigen chain terminator bifunctional methyltransferase/kinase WbdD [Halomonadaceae bacterium LMG 33818]|uniref:class I SAM-dependent methyltransferase n=1 Tax=Cernens ardua TaxID=3402176 RepID=UPI003EDB8DFE